MNTIDVKKVIECLSSESDTVYSVLEFQDAFGEVQYKLCASEKEELDFLIHGDHKGYPISVMREGEVTEHGKKLLNQS